MANVAWASPALDDLQRIIDFIALDKPNAAKGFAKEVFTKVSNLEKFPKRGKLPPELEGTFYLEMIVSPARIIYRIEGDDVIILHILRGEIVLDSDLLSYRNNFSQG